VVVDPVAELMRDDVERADPLVGRVVADLDLRPVVEGIHVVEADADGDPAARAVHAVAPEPLIEHPRLLLDAEERVHAAGLLDGGVPVAPGVG